MHTFNLMYDFSLKGMFMHMTISWNKVDYNWKNHEMPMKEYSHQAHLLILVSDGTFELEVLFPIDTHSRWELGCSPGSVVDLL